MADNWEEVPLLETVQEISHLKMATARSMSSSYVRAISMFHIEALAGLKTINCTSTGNEPVQEGVVVNTTLK
jgi:hypothetical protein